MSFTERFIQTSIEQAQYSTRYLIEAGHPTVGAFDIAISSLAMCVLVAAVDFPEWAKRARESLLREYTSADVLRGSAREFIENIDFEPEIGDPK